MEETGKDQTTTGSASSSESASHRHPVRGKLWELEGRWLMGRAGPGEMLEGIGRYLRLETPERRDELLAAIRTRAKQLEEADKDLPVDGPSTGMLALTSTALARDASACERRHHHASGAHQAGGTYAHDSRRGSRDGLERPRPQTPTAAPSAPLAASPSLPSRTRQGRGPRPAG